MEASNSKSNFRTRGRIAEVLASARASLQEPSRPYTPASLDARTSLGAYSGDALGLLSNKSSQSSLGSGLHSQLRSSMQDPFQSPAYDILEVHTADEPGHPQTVQVGGRATAYSSHFIKPSKGGSLHLNHNNQGQQGSVQVLMLDLQDATTTLDGNVTTAAAVFSDGRKHAESIIDRLSSSLDNLLQAADKLVKLLKDSSQLSSGPPAVSTGTSGLTHSAQRDIRQALQRDTVATLLRLANLNSPHISYNDNGNGSDRIRIATLRQLACRHVLRLTLALSANTTLSVRAQQASSVPEDAAQAMRQAMRVMYEITVNPNANALQKQTVFSKRHSTSNNNNNNNNHNNSSSLISSHSDNGHDESGHFQDEQGDILVVGGVDLVVSFFAFLWARFAVELNKDVKATQAQLQSQDKSFLTLLDAAAFAAGIVRHYSNTELNRKRLLHIGAWESVGTGLQVIAQCYTAHQVPNTAANSSVGSNSTPTNANTNAVSPEMYQRTATVLVQLIAAERNFSVDSSGRTQLLESRLICVVCSLLPLFRTTPDLLLNCARVTAKLSLLEPFRSQINSKPVHIKCLVDVIISEAMRCQQIMDGGGNGGTPDSASQLDVDENDDDDSGECDDEGRWPSWHTWPLLSRVAFTLGNLTTSNNANRLIIGVDCKCLKPLVVLLQACACTVAHLTQMRDFDDEDAEENDDYDEVEVVGELSGKERKLPAAATSDKVQKPAPTVSEIYEDLDDPSIIHLVTKPATASAATTAVNTVSMAKPFRPGNLASTIRHSSDSDSSSDGGDELDPYSSKSSGDQRNSTGTAISAVHAGFHYDVDDIEDIDERYGGGDDSNGMVLLATASSNGQAHSASKAVVSSKGASKTTRAPISTGESNRGDDKGDAADDDSAEQELVDATVKLLRLLANLSIDQSIGTYIAQRSEPFQMLLELLSCAKEMEELLLNVVATCTNLTFYACNISVTQPATRESERVDVVLKSLALHLSYCLFHENEELVLESVRALGNLTRRQTVLRAILFNRIDEALILLLSHSNPAIVAAVTGTLINLTANLQTRESLMKMPQNICHDLTSVLKKSSLKDISLSILVCQVLHNLFSKDSSRVIMETFSASIPTSVEDTLKELLDCAEDLVSTSEAHAEDENYISFVRISRLVLAALDDIF